jgi:hypothetical protein
MRILPDRSEIKNPYGIEDSIHLSLSAGFDAALDAVYSQAIDLDIDTLAEEWRIEIVARIHSKEHRDYIKFSDFIVERIGGK